MASVFYYKRKNKAVEIQSPTSSIIENNVKIPCNKCNETLFACGKDDMSSWWDLFCFKCNTSFELKTNSHKNRMNSKSSLLIGGNYFNYTKLTKPGNLGPPTLIVIDYVVKSMKKDIYSISLKTIRYYEPYTYVVRNLKSCSKSLITCPKNNYLEGKYDDKIDFFVIFSNNEIIDDIHEPNIIKWSIQ